MMLDEPMHPYASGSRPPPVAEDDVEAGGGQVHVEGKQLETIDGLGLITKRKWFGEEFPTANYCANECL